MGDIPDRRSAERTQLVRGYFTDTPEILDRQRVQEPDRIGDDEHAIGLPRTGGNLRHELRRSTADRAHKVELLADAHTDQLRDLFVRAVQTMRAGDVAERFI